MKSDKVLIVGGLLAVGVLGYVLFKKGKAAPSKAPTQTGATGPYTYTSGWNPTGGLTAANIGGSYAAGGSVNGAYIGNPGSGDTPIALNKLTGEIFNRNTMQPVSPSSWQGTTNKSGSVTYLNNELAGEGSSILGLQGVTY